VSAMEKGGNLREDRFLSPRGRGFLTRNPFGGGKREGRRYGRRLGKGWQTPSGKVTGGEKKTPLRE